MKYLLLIALIPVFISWSVIPYAQMPYATVGNWEWHHGRLHISTARLSHRRYEILVLTHETIEALICGITGVRQAQVDVFDIQYERERKIVVEGKFPIAQMVYGLPITATSEAGDDPTAPYHRAHIIATNSERQLAWLLRVDWDAYTKEVESL